MLEKPEKETEGSSLPVAKAVECQHRNSGLYVGTCDYSTIIMIHQENKFPCWLHIHTPQPFPLTTFTSWFRNSLKGERGCGWSGKKGGGGSRKWKLFLMLIYTTYGPLFFFPECLIILTIQKVISQNSYHHSFSSLISSVKTFSYIRK